TARTAWARRKMRASLVCCKNVSKVGRASWGKCSLRVRIRVVSRIKYYKNIHTPRHPTWFPDYRSTAFSTQIFRNLLSGARGPQTHVSYACLPRVLPPRSRLTLDEVLSFDLSPIGKDKCVGLFALNKQCAVVLLANMLHKLRVAKPAIGDHHRRGQLQASSSKSQPPFIEH